MLPLLLALLLAAPSGASQQDEKLADAKARFEQLKSDSRRRRYREGWESLLRELDAAARAAPKGARAAEVALTAARVRVELYGASKAPADAKAAFAALRKVDDEHPGPFGLQALHAAVLLSWHTKNPGDRVVAARRLIERYPNSAEAKAVAARSAELSGGPSVAPRAVVSAAVPARPAASDLLPPRATKPVVEQVESVEGASSDNHHVEPQVPAVANEDQDEKPALPAATVPAPPMVLAKVPAVATPRAVATKPQPAAVTTRAQASSKPAGRLADEAGDGDDEEDESAGPPEPEAVEVPPSKTGPIIRAVKDAVAALTTPEDEPATAAKARELRSHAFASGNSIASQLGLRVRRIVIDAGHGGKDTGAIGPHGVREKDMALAIARKVAARLKAFGFTVVMTRSDDTFIALDDRTRIANEARADLFVSIHCNAAKRRKLEGVETWTLNVAADRYSARLAAFENADADHTVSDLRLILADLATKSNASDARELARLKSARFQDGTADAISRGVKDFVESRRELASVP
jgi:N-acetylmuramoyl-L-alanine amidase